MELTEIFNNLGAGGNAFTFSVLSVLKLPIILTLVGNVLFSTILFLRVRILADIFKAPQNKIIKTIVATHIGVVIIGTLFSLLFVILA